jgi:hypothetical protein
MNARSPKPTLEARSLKPDPKPRSVRLTPMPLDGDDHPRKLGLRLARDAALARLSESFARDELSLEDFERRVDAAYGANTENDLGPIVADLPAPPANALAVAPVVPLARATPDAGSTPPRLALAVFGNLERRVIGGVPTGAAVVSVFGNVELDLRDLDLPPGVTELRIIAVFGNVELTVPPTLAVECRGSPVFSSFANLDRRPRESSGEAVLRVVGTAVFGNVEIKTLPSRALLAAGAGRGRLPPAPND